MINVLLNVLLLACPVLSGGFLMLLILMINAAEFLYCANWLVNYFVGFAVEWLVSAVLFSLWTIPKILAYSYLMNLIAYNNLIL